MFFQFVSFRGFKTSEDVRKVCLEYAENIKMMEGQATPIFRQEKRMDKKEREDKTDELCEQVAKLHLMMAQQPRQGPKQVELACYMWRKKGHYASQCWMSEERTCFKGAKEGHTAPACRSNFEMPPKRTYCHRVGHTTDACFVRRSDEAVDKQGVRFSKHSAPAESKEARHSGQNNFMFVHKNEPVQDDDTVTAFNRSADG